MEVSSLWNKSVHIEPTCQHFIYELNKDRFEFFVVLLHRAFVSFWEDRSSQLRQAKAGSRVRSVIY